MVALETHFYSRLELMLTRYSGLFITVEGIDGAGKSTHIPYIESVLRDEGQQVIKTREPGGSPASDTLRRLLLEETLSPESELLLMFASRQEHLNHTIRPALAEGRCVLCDRFTDSSYAYQGNGRGIENDLIQTLESWIQKDLQPDLTLLFDIPVSVSVERRKQRHTSNHKDRFEEESIYFYERVRQGYLERVRKHPHRFYVIDASKTIEEIQSKLKEFIHEWLRYYYLSERHPLHH
jgi:dTMP kinase